MTLEDIAFNTVQIVGFRPSYAPRPECCDNPAVLCVNCAAEALLIAANEQGLVLNVEGFDDDTEDYLPLPSMNASFEGSIPHGTDAITRMTEEQEAEYERNKENLRRLSLSDDDADILLPPRTMEAVTNARLQELSSNNIDEGTTDDDVLPLPGTFPL